MSRKLPPLNGLRAFEASARHMSFTDAADELCVTQGAISRQMKSLEERLGVTLFKRMTRRLELTEAGAVLFPVARRAFDDLERAVLRIMDHGNAGVLTVSALPTFAMNWLMPRLPDFNNKHPDIEVQLVMTIRPVNFSRGDVDVAIRVGRLEGLEPIPKGPRIDLTMIEDWDGVVAKRLLSDELVPVITPELMKTQPKVKIANDLDRFKLLHVGTRKNAWPDWLEAVEAGPVDTNHGPVFGHFFQSLQAAKNGQGIALIPRILVEKEIESGELIIAFHSDVQSDGAYYLLFRPHYWNLPKITAFQKWIEHA